MTNKELLELAAKASGIEGRYASLDEFPDWMTVHDGEGVYYTSSQAWNPLTDDGDALRLAVKLGMMVDVGSGGFCTADVEELESSVNEVVTPDPYAATRRAIVRAAAEIGKATV
jgi:hypothetical protein